MNEVEIEIRNAQGDYLQITRSGGLADALSACIRAVADRYPADAAVQAIADAAASATGVDR